MMIKKRKPNIEFTGAPPFRNGLIEKTGGDSLSLLRNNPLDSLSLVQYDSEEGGSHGGLFGGGAGHYTFGVEAMRTWKDWEEHIAPIALGGIEIPGATRVFGRQLNTHTRDIGGLVQYEHGYLSIGVYGGATMPSHRTFGGGLYFTIRGLE